MKRTILVLLLCFLLNGVASAQGLLFHQSDLWTLPYEDLSDILRRYPGMYPLDYGTLGAPLAFRPWNLHPWELRVERDGIPQNRRFDGLYEPNLQPAGELETIGYDFLSGGAAGLFSLTTRTLKADTPYSEFQIREGYYGYGTVDFAHGQRLHRSLTLEMTGRLGWYDGMRTPSASRATRVRGRVGMDLSRRWRAQATYSGSNVKTQFLLNPRHDYMPSRVEGILEIHEKDSLRTVWSPSLTIYSREDRETWGSPWHARELSSGLMAEVHAEAARQHFTFRQFDSWTDINFPGMSRRSELTTGLTARDSLALSVCALDLSAEIRRESGWSASCERDQRWLADFSARAVTQSWQNLRLRAGGSYSESAVPIGWWNGEYRLTDRPLVIAPEMTNLTLNYAGGHQGVAPVDRYLSSEVGVRWSRGRALCDVAMMTMARPGDFSSRFVASDTTVSLIYERDPDRKTQVGFAGGAVVPLWYGLRIESWWFRQANSSDIGQASDTRGWSRLYFERAFFKSPLTVRSHISHEYLGKRWAFSDRFPAGVFIGPSHVFGFRLSATVRGVTLVWGTENVLNEHYSLMPGYRMIAKEEYLAFIWRLWL
jgi:hypothetical protein